jgi:branched-chain amino acid transport system substrate-binding protein
LAQQAISSLKELSGSIQKDRTAVRDALAKIQDFDGITGKMTFSGSGDPKKCAVIVKISEKGEYEFYKSVCPD